MFPLHDESAKHRKKPYLTIVLIAINVLIFILTFFSADFDTEIIWEYGAIPNQISEGKSLLTLITSMFLHGGIMHLIGNMWFLWVFGDNIEHRLGKIKYVLFYFLTGIIASLTHVYTVSADLMHIPTIGASGAISGIIGGYAILFPKNRIRAFMWFLVFGPIFFYLPAFLYIGIWFFYQIIYVGTITPIAYMAHIGGFVSGIILIKLFKKRKKIFKK